MTFEGFADSSLTFVLRCYIAMKDMPSRLQIIDQLHTAVDDAFRQLGGTASIQQEPDRSETSDGSQSAVERDLLELLTEDQLSS